MGRKKGLTVESAERARRAVQLKVAGATWEKIAAELGMKTEAGPRLLVRKYFHEVKKDQYEDMYPILVERAEQLWVRAYTRLIKCETTNAPIEDWDRAMRQCQSAHQTLARISGHLDGPKVEVNVEVGVSADVRELREQFRALREPAVIPGHVIDAQE